MNLGNAVGEQGKPDVALSCYERVIALNPRSVQAHYNRANVLCRADEVGRGRAGLRAGACTRSPISRRRATISASSSRRREKRRSRRPLSRRHRASSELGRSLCEPGQGAGRTRTRQGGDRVLSPSHRAQARPCPGPQQSRRSADEPGQPRARLSSPSGTPSRACPVWPRPITISASHCSPWEETTRRFNPISARLQPSRTLSRRYNNLARIYISERATLQALDTLKRALEIREADETKALLVECMKGRACHSKCKRISRNLFFAR